jgi:pimeloyl-ACP methyl ester carboxylesterase
MRYGGRLTKHTVVMMSSTKTSTSLTTATCIFYLYTVHRKRANSQYTWCDTVRDFGLQIVKTPFYLAGNSIGGYTCMGVAAEAPSLCKGVILCNSAGNACS